MFAQLASCELQRTHWYVNVIGCVPLQAPGIDGHRRPDALRPRDRRRPLVLRCNLHAGRLREAPACHRQHRQQGSGDCSRKIPPHPLRSHRFPLRRHSLQRRDPARSCERSCKTSRGPAQSVWSCSRLLSRRWACETVFSAAPRVLGRRRGCQRGLQGPAGFLLPSAGPSSLARSSGSGFPSDMAQMCHGTAATVARRESHRPVGSRRGAASGPPLLSCVEARNRGAGRDVQEMSAPGLLGGPRRRRGGGFRPGSLGEERRA